MLTYIVLFLFCILMLIIDNLLISKREKSIINIITLIVLCTISGTRYYLGGSDYYIYLSVFNSIPKLDEFLKNFTQIDALYQTFGMEKGYLLFNSFIKTLGFNFYGFTLIHSIIVYSLMYIGLKKYTKNFSFLIIVFLYKMFFYDTFISLRQSISIAIFLVSIKYIVDRKFIKYFICCIIATLFHNASLILLPIYFINRIKLSKKSIIILNLIFIPTMLISYFNLPILTIFNSFVNLFSNTTMIEKANDLFNNMSSESINIFHTIEYFIIMALIISKYDKIIEINPLSEVILKLFILLLPIFTLLRGYEILTREKDFFILSYPIILEYIWLIDSRKYKLITQISTIGICAYGFFRFIYLFDNGAMMPYVSYLLKDISIFN